MIPYKELSHLRAQVITCIYFFHFGAEEKSVEAGFWHLLCFPQNSSKQFKLVF